MNITRRYFLKTTGALTAYCGLSPFQAFGREEMQAIENAKSVAQGKTLVAIFLRGGMDGLNMVVPYGDEHYYQLRPNLAVRRPKADDGALDLDGFFGLSPHAKELYPLFQNGMAVAMHAVGYDKNTRSHFEEQDVWETGVIGNTINSDGWLNRHLLTSKGNGPIRAVSIGNSLPRILRGDAPAMAVKGISDLQAPASYADAGSVGAALEHAYCSQPSDHYSDARDLLSQTGEVTLEGMELIKNVLKDEYKPAGEYPDGNLGKQLQETARLIKANVGLEVVGIDFGGWDTHQNQPNGFNGLTQQLSKSIAAFVQDLGDRMDDVLVLTLSDFGRTAAQNGNNGTDHGWANCMLAIGGAVQAKGKGAEARQVMGDWPGLGPDQLNQGRDLLHTTDFRDVLGEVVRQHLGNENIEKILPKHQFKPVGLI